MQQPCQRESAFHGELLVPVINDLIAKWGVEGTKHWCMRLWMIMDSSPVGPQRQAMFRLINNKKGYTHFCARWVVNKRYEKGQYKCRRIKVLWLDKMPSKVASLWKQSTDFTTTCQVRIKEWFKPSTDFEFYPWANVSRVALSDGFSFNDTTGKHLGHKHITDLLICLSWESRKQTP